MTDVRVSADIIALLPGDLGAIISVGRFPYKDGPGGP
jgi:hypothetical protein